MREPHSSKPKAISTRQNQMKDRNMYSTTFRTRVASVLASCFATALGLLAITSVALASGVGQLSPHGGKGSCIAVKQRGCLKGRALFGTEQIAISPDGRNLYAASYVGNSVVVLNRDPRSGVLSQRAGKAGCVREHGEAARSRCTPGRAIEDPTAVVVSPDGKNVYVVAHDSSAIAIFDRDPQTGGLTQKEGTAGCVSSEPSEDGCGKTESILGPLTLGISPDGRSVYVGSSGASIEGHKVGTSASGRSISIFDRDAGTGALTQRLGRAGCVSGAGNGGECEFVDGLGSVLSLAISPDGRNLYVANRGPDSVVVFDREPLTGSLTRAPGRAGCFSSDGTDRACTKTPDLGFPSSLTLSPDGRNLYVGAQASAAIAVFDRDGSTGALTRKRGRVGCVSAKPGCTPGRQLRRANSVAVSPDGRNLYATGYGGSSLDVFDRNGSSGALRQKPGAAGCFGRGLPSACRDVPSLDDLGSVVVSPDGRNVYVASINGNISILDRSRR
jgi:DNA-binding beta-propeller fold protein YncE